MIKTKGVKRPRSSPKEDNNTTKLYNNKFEILTKSLIEIKPPKDLSTNEKVAKSEPKEIAILTVQDAQMDDGNTIEQAVISLHKIGDNQPIINQQHHSI